MTAATQSATPRVYRTEELKLQAALVRLDLAWEKRWPFPRGRYLPLRLHNLLYRTGVLRPVWAEFLPGIAMRADSRDYIAQQFLLGGRYEPHIAEYFMRTLGPGDVFLDIGANAGLYSLAAARRVGPGGRVLAFEPNPSMAAAWRETVAFNGATNCTLYPLALAEAEGFTELFISSRYNTGKSSFSARNAASSTSVRVQVRTLDNVFTEAGLSQARLVKIDVEGAELLVLRGARRLLETLHPDLIVELIAGHLAAFGASVAEVFDLLAGLGYSGEWLDDTNAVFTRR